MKRKKIIGVCVSSIHKIAVHQVLTALSENAQKHGYSLYIFAPFSDLYHKAKDDEAQQKIFDFIPYEKLCALIVFSELIKDFAVLDHLAKSGREHDIPVLTIKQTVDGCCNIKYDSEDALKTIISHLIDVHQCKRILFLSGVRGNDVSEGRSAVYRKTLAEHNYPVDESLILYGGFWAVPTKEALEEFFAGDPDLPDAIVCANDAMALAVCEFLSDRNIHVPEDIIVTGLGGINEREYHLPLLTTAIYDPELTSVYIIDILQQILDGTTPRETTLFIPCKIVYTESCGCVLHDKHEAELRLVSLFSQLESERGYCHAAQEFSSFVNIEGTIDALAEHLPNYISEPGISKLNLYIRTDFMRMTETGIPEETTAPFILFSHITTEGMTKLLRPCTLDSLWEREDEAFNGQLLSIPLNLQDDFFGFITLEYRGKNIIHESLYELVMAMDNLLGGIKKRAELILINQQLNDVSEKTIQSLAEIVEAKSEFTGLHVKRVSEYTRILAEAMGYSQEDVNIIRIASMMHDIGKINIPAEILEKPGRLTDEEFAIIKTHTTEGERLLHNAPGKIMETAKVIALQHHEKWNGTGYIGMKEEEILLESRIVALADVYDALVSKRPYKPPFSDEEAKNIIVKDSGTHFDPAVVDAFIRHFDKFLEIHANYPDEEGK